MDPTISPILDYASPRPRVKLRLPSNSVIRCTSEPGSCAVVETLTGQAGARLALAFAAFVLCVVIATPLGLSGRAGDYVGITSIEVTAIVGVSLLVIRNTWRKTVLRVAEGEMTVTFTAPLSPARRYAWHVGMLERVELVATEGNSLLGELRIIPDAGAEVHLFTDHRVAELHDIASMLDETIKYYAPTPAKGA